MRNYKLYSAILALGLLLFVFSGCSSMMMYNERAISLEDIVNLSKAELGTDVIISHIDATNSIFKLTSEEIIWLKNEGVDDDVIEYILETDIDSERFGWMNNTSPYDYWSYYSSSYYYPIYDYYYNRFSGYNYPYSYYYNRPFYNYNYGGLSLFNSPYYVRRRPGTIGRFYEMAPRVPLYNRDFYPRSGLRRSDDDGRSYETNDNDGENGSRRRDSDNNSSRQRGSENDSRSGRSGRSGGNGNR
ncbi:hypothetical protein ACFL2X_03995 [Candidatus Latescibacterota bacterium]